ncbi:hypothetical protein [Schinkia azotoformans]|uniref:Uncharacterized protein n=1 Tax=Schinkia azotoformans LMG 9581 TaxID=1131731 RepID=K6DK08_SCHAZ|nr:hypothetical protein [Schinkia azotoformans]EKN68463.1 hypothetical protein BAZO_03965 [Schinkia azotoformans LMG 9581]MEC1640837.1 hypothetical protein [Schinkia azotoformans]MEC1698095.1 hypothetical protein [Schinkia azotoformans]MEC1715417.1 hypothetical protein [Schinkia azotoformans]MEC1721065.1 hypothetical protein [Schinkia azotoformans]
MGKRKSSPRLATTSENDVVTIHYDQNFFLYTSYFVFTIVDGCIFMVGWKSKIVEVGIMHRVYR